MARERHKRSWLAIRAGAVGAALWIGLATAAHSSVTREVQLGRVLIKFHDSLTQCAHCLLQQRQAFASATTGRPTRVDSLNAQFGVESASCLFFERHDLSTDEANAMVADKLAAVRSRFPSRTARIPAQSPGPPKLASWYVFNLPPDRNPFEVCTEYLKDPHVAACQPDFLATADAAPNDPFYSSKGSFGQPYYDLWGLRNMRVEPGWQTTQGQGITVAVVDSGVDMTHPDMAGAFWSNPGEIVNGLDDDLNGHVDDVVGWDFVQNDNDPTDLYGHGTHVAGILGARGNNGIGTIGVAPQARIMVLRGLNQTGGGLMSWLSQAILYAANEGADVINNSWGCKDPCLSNPVAEDAVRTATVLGSVVIFAAGNDKQDVYLRSPQRMTDPITSPVVVAATDYKRKPADFDNGRGTNFGQTVDIAAPGGGRPQDASIFPLPVQNILAPLSLSHDSLTFAPQVLKVGNGYLRQAGTSMSAPHVAGAAALIEACNSSFTTLDVRYALQASGYSRKFTRDQIGFGQLRADRVLKHTDMPLHVLGGPDPDQVFKLGTHSVVPISGEVLGTPKSWEVYVGEGSAPSSKDLQRLVRASAPTVGPLADWNIASGVAPGVKTLILEASYKVPQESGSVFTCGASRPIGGSATRRLRAVRYISIQPPIAALTADDTHEYTLPTISGNRVAAMEYAVGNYTATRAVYVRNLLTGVVEWRGAVGSEFPSLDPGNETQLVYVDRSGPIAQIRYHNFQSGEDRQLSAAAAGYRNDPTISGNRVVWRDDGVGPGSQIVAYNLTTSTQTTISEGTAGIRQEPVVDGNRVLWTVKDQAGMRLHDLGSGQTQTILPNTVPTCASMSGNRVAWWAHEDDLIVGITPFGPIIVPIGHVYAHDLSTGETRTLTDRQWLYGCPAIDGSVVTWAANQDVSWVVFAHDLSRNESSRQLTFGQLALAGTRLDVSGQRIVFIDSQDQIPNQLYLLDLNSF
jgi:subtilisin family serine protease